MNPRAQLVGIAVVLAVLLGVPVKPGEAADGRNVPGVKVVKLDPGDKSYLLLLGGPPETASMRSGLVTLAPGASIGKHNTEKFEEMLVPLAGEGELRITGRLAVRIKPGLITYAPAHTEHDVTNIGLEPLRYIFIVAKAE